MIKDLRERVAEHQNEIVWLLSKATKVVYGSGDLGYITLFDGLASKLYELAEDGTLADALKRGYFVETEHKTLVSQRKNTRKTPSRAGEPAIYDSLVRRLSDHPEYVNVLESHGDKPKYSAKTLMKLATLAVLTEDGSEMTVRELRHHMRTILPYNFSQRWVHNIHHDSLRRLRRAGLIEMRTKPGSSRIHLYRIADKLRKEH